jgi:hypothetical protein
VVHLSLQHYFLFCVSLSVARLYDGGW